MVDERGLRWNEAYAALVFGALTFVSSGRRLLNTTVGPGTYSFSK